MFNQDFYPTPKEVITQMCFDLDLNGRTVLEPSAGSGNIINYLKELGAKVIACELHPELALIAQKKADHFLKNNFFEVNKEEVSHINAIIMNPPFSQGERHILHAWDIAPDGCEIVALCNFQTIENSYSYNRKSLKQLIGDHGSYFSIGNAFSTAERKTEVEIALVKLFKPKAEGENEFEGYFDLTEEFQQQANAIMPYNDVTDALNRYIAAVKQFNDVAIAEAKINKLIKPINSSGHLFFGAFQHRGGKDYSVNREDFKKELQKSAWMHIFSLMKMEKYLTKSILGDINKFVEQQTKVPFTLRNIFKMAQLIKGTHPARMDKVLVDAFDKICDFSYENSEAGHGWKTNSSYKVNQKFILPYMVSVGFSGELRISYHSSEKQSDMDDIVKALCFLTGRNYDLFENLWTFVNNTKLRDENGNVMKEKNGFNDKYRNLDFGKWYRWNEFFDIRGYKKGTMHVRFVDEKVWMEFNRRVAKIKGWALPKKTDNKTKGTERTKKTAVEIY